MSDATPTPGQAARKAWGEHWAAATANGRGKPGYDSLAYENAAWEAAATAASASLAAECERLRGLVRDILQSMPDTADEQEWRDRAGAAGVTDPDGEPYRAYTEDDLCQP